MAIVQLFPSGSDFAPGVVTTFPADVVPFINSSQETDYEANFTYQSSNLGIGLSSSLLGRLHVKGANDSSGYSAYIQSSTYDLLKAGNNRTIVFGPGSSATTTSYTFNAIGAGATDTTATLQIVGGSSDNIFRFLNSTSYTRGGLEIVRNSISHSRTALAIYGSSTQTMFATSGGAIQWPTQTTWPDGNLTYITRSNSSGYNGLVFNTQGSSTESFIFHKGRTVNTLPGDSNFMRLYSSFTDNGNADTANFIFHKMDPTLDFTGAGTINIIGYDWDPTLTAMNGGNYGLLMRSGLAGFGLGATMPTAVVDISASTTARASLRVQPGTAPTSPNNGDIWTDTTDIFIRLNGTTYTITKT